MSMKLNRRAYERLIAENIEWLRKQPRTLEREHTIGVLERSAMHEYSDRQVEVEGLQGHVSYLKGELSMARRWAQLWKRFAIEMKGRLRRQRWRPRRQVCTCGFTSTCTCGAP